MPDRFDLTYIGDDGAQRRAFVVHRSSIGAIERLMALLIEHYAGAFPLWLAPVQVKVIPVSLKQADYAREIFSLLRDAGIRVELDDSNETLGKRIREGKMQKVPYLAIVGDKEKENRTITAEGRAGKAGSFAPEDFVSKLKEEIANKTL